MRKSMKTILAALALATPLALTSCEGTLDDVLGEWSRPTPGNNTNTTPAASNTYLKWNGTDALVATEIPSDAKVMSASETTWNGTYIVDKDIEITGDVTLGGDVDLIIKDGFTLSLASDKKINYTTTEGYKLNIYSQSNGDGAGTLTISTTTPGAYPIAVQGTLNIHSGNVNATAIGGGSEGIYADNFNIYGGKVVITATGVALMAGDLKIYDGADITSTSTGADGEGIQAYTSMTVNGSTTKITATGAMHGIDAQGTTTITINDGTIIANAGATSANPGGIAITGTIIIEGGNVTANGGTGATGTNAIGGEGFDGAITVNGGKFTGNGGAGDGFGAAGKGISGISTITLGTGISLYEDDAANPTALAANQAQCTKQYAIIQ